jgi:hypothetical protein
VPKSAIADFGCARLFSRLSWRSRFQVIARISHSAYDELSMAAAITTSNPTNQKDHGNQFEQRKFRLLTYDQLRNDSVEIGSTKIEGWDVAKWSAALSGSGYPKSADPSEINYIMIELILLLMVIYVTMVYGPIAAFLVEMFPTRVRYTSMSLPYHIGNGWFGGMLPLLATAVVAATGEAVVSDRSRRDDPARGIAVPARYQGRRHRHRLGRGSPEDLNRRAARRFVAAVPPSTSSPALRQGFFHSQ